MNEVEIIARGIIIKEGKILLCRAKFRKNWFFPGGHLEPGETVPEALRRELREELAVEVLKTNFIGVVENSFTDEENIFHQEINLVFETEIEKMDVTCQESHLEFCWFDMDKLEEIYVLPERLKMALKKWIADRKIFYFI